MSIKSILLFAIVLFTGTLPLHGQDESELAHFQSYFSGKYAGSLEHALNEATLHLQQAEEISDARLEADARRNLGLIHLNGSHDYEAAMDLFIGALAIEDSLDLEDQKFLTLIAIARVFEVVGDHHKSAQFLEQSLALSRENRNINSVAMALNNLGKVNASRGQINDAFSNYQHVLRFRDDISKTFEADALFNLADLYTMQGNYEEALGHHKSALAINRALGDRYAEAVSLNNIGVLYALMKNDAKSLANHQVALGIRQDLKDKSGVAESYNNLAGVYFRQNDFAAAISNGLIALGHARESQAQEQLFKSYDLLSQAYKGTGDYKNGLMYRELSLAIYEFIQNERHERQLLETQNRYVVGKKESEIQKLDAVRIEREREIAEQKRFRNALFALVGLVFVIAGLLLILYLVKRRSNIVLQVARKEVQQHNAKLQELNQTKDKFFSIISHDLKGPLNSLTSFSHLLINHTDSLSKEEIRMLAGDLDKSVRNLLGLLENLLEWSRSQTGNIDFSPEVFDLVELLEKNKSLLQSQASNKNITIVVEPADEYPVRLHKASINTVVRNLVSNAIKFTGEGGRIVLDIRNAGGHFDISIADNGVGMSQEVMARLFRLDSKHTTPGTANEKGTGLGLILCREFVEKNGGKIAVRSAPGNGSVFSMTFPVSAAIAKVAKITAGSL